MTSPAEFICVLPTEVAAYGAAAAIVVAHIRYRCNLSGWYRVSQTELAAAVGLSRDQIVRALSKLPEVVLERKQTDDRDRTVLYRATPAIVRIHTTPDQSLCENAQCIVRNCTGGCAKSHNVPISKKVEEKEQVHSPTDVGADVDELAAKKTEKAVTKATKTAALEAEFEAWWKVYPRREAKIAARKAYATARTKTTADVLLSGAKAYAEIAAAARATATDGRNPVAHGATWLNGERWTDETVAHAVPQSQDNALDWIRDCYRDDANTKLITDRTGMSFHYPPQPMDLTREEAVLWRKKMRQDWITENHNEILRRLTMKAVS